ncbi:AIF1-like protein [Mya arenaria]|uniref:AIF1-like protein n=1 Tax=Mya arenaria TaxID=6604 RepID=A0ABY7ED25_MYAAR|nr:AIF1-like protein [Mya arenaria]
MGIENRTGSRNYGIKVNPEEQALDAINKEILDDPDYKEVEDLEERLQTFKAKFMEFDKDADGNIGTICYRDFISMMVGSKSSVLKLILLFEQKAKEQERPTGVAPKRDLASLP